MMYKTIVLELLTERKELHEQLRLTRQLPATLETYSQQLKASHLSWMETLSAANPSSDPIQIQSEAMELAVKELEDHLPPASQPDEPEPLSLDAAIAFIADHTSKK